MYGYVYKTTNIVNGKIYIGQHKSEHFDRNYYGSGVKLKNAIRKYGIQNFIVEIICWCETKQEIDYKERFCIAFFKSQCDTLGYNIADGGEGGDIFSNLSVERQSEISYKLKQSWLNRPEKEKQQLKLKYARGGKIREAKITNEDRTRRSNLISEKLSNRVHIHKGNIHKMVKDYELDDYIKIGYELGQRSSERVNIYKDGKNIRVEKSELQNYINQGWKKGTGHTTNYNKKWMNNSTVEKFILLEECTKYTSMGWNYGRLKRK